MQMQRFAGSNDLQIPFVCSVGEYLQTADEFDPQNFEEKRLISRRMLRDAVGDALVAALFHRFQLFAFPSEAVAVEFCNSEHIRHAIAESGFGAGPLDLLRMYRSVPRLALRFIA
jgi:hypothetical protein